MPQSAELPAPALTPEQTVAAIVDRFRDSLRLCGTRSVTYEFSAALREALADASRAGAERMRERAAQAAGGVTGPGNTVDQCQGYSDACRDAAAAVRTLPLDP